MPPAPRSTSSVPVLLSFPQPLVSLVPFPQSRDLLPHPLSLPAGCLGAACQGASSSKQAVPELSIPSATALRGHLVTTAMLLRGHTIPAHYMAPWSIAPNCCSSSHEPELRGGCSGVGRRGDIGSGAGHVPQQPCDLFCPRYPSAAALNSRGPLSSCAAASSPGLPRGEKLLRCAPAPSTRGRGGEE